MRRIHWVRPLLIIVVATGLGCSNDKHGTPTTPVPPSSLPTTISLVPVAGGFTDPVYMIQPPGSDSRMFVVEKGGRIKVVKNGVTNGTPFLDITGLVATGYEQGLLSMAFRSDYATSGRFYVCYTATNWDVIVARYHVSSGNPDVAASAADEVVLRVPHSQSNEHNGGLIRFGPDGKLYVSLGDGVDGGGVAAQDPDSKLGKILRIDVSGSSGYTVPSDNPFGNETWSYGLRNPWRFSFDRSTGDLYVADVGEAQYEEVDVATAGSGRGKSVNFGWSMYEGTHCYAGPCSPAGKTMPVLEYAHVYDQGGQGDNAYCVIGGYVYRGSAVPGLQGHYLYGDVGGTWLKSFRYSGGAVTEATTWNVRFDESPLSFAEDHQGELYVLTNGGTMYRIAP